MMMTLMMVMKDDDMMMSLLIHFHPSIYLSDKYDVVGVWWISVSIDHVLKPLVMSLRMLHHVSGTVHVELPRLTMCTLCLSLSERML
jgi:hypothetical protein